MPPKPTGNLTIASEGEVRLSEVRAFLAAVEDAYNGALLFQRTLDMLPRWRHEYAESDKPPFWGFWPLITVASKRGKPVRLRKAFIASLVSKSDSLVLHSVRLESPGEWQFFGLPDPLEVIRKYLNDRHERKKDEDYREAREEERLTLENDILRTQALSKRVELAKSVGATDEDLAPLKELLLYEPLETLARFQDTGLITETKAPVDEPPTFLPGSTRKITLPDKEPGEG